MFYKQISGDDSDGVLGVQSDPALSQIFIFREIWINFIDL